MRACVVQYDHDNDGQIALEEIRQLLHDGNRDLEQDIPRSVLDEILERADWDSNRMLSYEEFTRMVSVVYSSKGSNWPIGGLCLIYFAVGIQGHGSPRLTQCYSVTPACYPAFKTRKRE